MKKIFSLFAFSVFSLTLTALVLAISGLFQKSLLIFFGLLFFFLFLLWSRRHFSRQIFFEKRVWAVVLMSFVWMLFSFHYSEPSIFSGRDQGSFSEAAIRLVQNGKLDFSNPSSREFFHIYGEGRAYNFPGFSYTHEGALKTQFPLGYVSFLGIFYAFFGIVGLKIANLTALFIFFLSFYFLSERILKKNTFLPVIFSLTSLLFFWFSKFTLGENLALALLWFAIWKIREFWEEEKKADFFLASLSFSILLFVRLETLLILASLLVIFWIRYKKLSSLFSKIGTFNGFFYLALGGLFSAGFVINVEFYIFIFKGFWGGIGGSFSAEDGIWQEIIRTFNIFSAYSILIFLAFSLLGINYFFRKKDWAALLPFFIILPTYVFLLDPNISNDHPWMLRRFLYSLIPAFFLYTAVFLEVFFKKKRTFLIFSSLLVLFNLLILWPYFSFVPNKGLLQKTQELSQHFADNDLVLVDRLSSGDPYSMLSGPLSFLFNKQAVYFFNPEDLGRLDLNKFSRIFFLIPDNNLDFYQKSGLLKKMVFQDTYQLNLETLRDMDESRRINLPARENSVVSGGIYEYLK